jgi:hypothetical protein
MNSVCFVHEDLGMHCLSVTKAIKTKVINMEEGLIWVDFRYHQPQGVSKRMRL